MSLQESLFREIAEAIRQKGGTSDPIAAKDFADAILALPEGGGSTGPVKAPKLTVTSKVIQHAEWIDIHSDTELASTISLESFNIEDLFDVLIGVIRNDALNFTINCTDLQVGNNFKLQARPELFINNNGTSNTISYNIHKHVIDDLCNTPVGLTDVIKSSSYIDSGSYSVPINITPWNQLASSMNIDADGTIIFGRNTIKINSRDESLIQLSYNVYEMKDGTQALKVRWRGLAHYSTLKAEYAFELFLVNGAIVLYLINQPPEYWSGLFTLKTPFGTQQYTLSAEKPFVTFYWSNYTYYKYNIVNEKLDGNKILKQVPSLFTLDELIESDDYYMSAALLETRADDNSVSINISPWEYKGTQHTSCMVNGNSWISLTGYNELIKLNRRDAAVWSVYCILTTISFSKTNMNATKVRWDGASSYKGSRDLIWDLYLFENGDAMIHLIKSPSTFDGIFNFCGADYTISIDSPFVSFYRQDVEGTSWLVDKNKYNYSDTPKPEITDSIGVDSIDSLTFNSQYVSTTEQFELRTDYTFVSVEAPIDTGKLARLEINTEQFARVDEIRVEEVSS